MYYIGSSSFFQLFFIFRSVFLILCKHFKISKLQHSWSPWIRHCANTSMKSLVSSLSSLFYAYPYPFQKFFCISVRLLSNIRITILKLHMSFSGSNSFRSYSQILLIAVILFCMPIRDFSIISKTD